MATTLRIKFSRLGPIKYLGHLDMMRYFQKAVARSGIDIAYSEGYHPHQIMSFAYPLGVAMETNGDYMDIDVNSFTSTEAVTDSLNAVMNEGVSIVKTYAIPDNAENAMASVYSADYYIDTDIVPSKEDVDKLLSMPEILVTKEGKKGPITKDIKPGIFKLEIIDNRVYMLLKSGSSLNIKPTDVIDWLGQSSGKKINIIQITRNDIYRLNDNGEQVSLGEF